MICFAVRFLAKRPGDREKMARNACFFFGEKREREREIETVRKLIDIASFHESWTAWKRV